ncbi:inositol monophosphatase [uncultured Roseobacter sp.]|uniref:inositol monophosphatase family protein n=1 Tax=uncultured Roseobacter sp. TaxID=114847 RepID=UPI0026133D46|nr:inositol monophosphatase [uncultured Roseobacter sp.]
MLNRSDVAEQIARSAGALALDYFQKLNTLVIEDKGPQDFVSEADKAVELHVRAGIEAAFPEDGIVGEEHAPKTSSSGYTWIIDPIDGTTNFVTAIPVWCVVIAVVCDDKAQIGVTYDPIHDEMFVATRGAGATLNGERLVCNSDTAITRGSVSTGYCNRISAETTVRVLQGVTSRGGVFHRNASGALSLAYVAGGRLIGYLEEHMNAWDCLAGQLLISEAGGRVEEQSADDMIANGGRVVAGSAGVFDDLIEIANEAYGA